MACITAAGDIWTWGKSMYGQRGHKKSTGPQKVDGDVASLGITRVEAGRLHTVALSKNGEVYSWGYGGDGAIGHGDKKNVKSPKIVEGLKGENVVDVSCGREHSLVVTDKGVVYTFGSDDYGQLGVGKGPRYQRTPVVVRALEGKAVVKVAAGEVSLCITHFSPFCSRY